MPRLYLSPTEVFSYPAAIALALPITQLQNAGTGALDLALMRASRRADGIAKKRLGAPGTTTVGTGGIAAGATSLPVASTLGFDDGAEQAVLIDTGSLQEVIPLVSGGIALTLPPVSPYPGTLTLAQPTASAHSAGATVQCVYQEVITAKSSGWEPYTTTILTQEAQIALSHAPIIGQSGAMLTRRVFVKHYPIIGITKIEHAYPFSNDWGTLDTNGVLIEPASGFYKLSLGSIVIPRGLIRTTYTAGYSSIPGDIKEAVAYLFADELTMIANAAGALEETQGKRRLKFSDGKSKTLWLQKAEEILTAGRYVRTV